MKSVRTLAYLFTIASSLLLGCEERRETSQAAATTSYREVEPLLRRACRDCHGEHAPAAGYSVADHWAAIGCTHDGRPVTRPPDPSAPLLRVLAREDHRGLLSRDQVSLLSAWLVAGTPKQRPVIHARGILDPRSEDWHGALAAADGYRALWDSDTKLACGRCHEGAPIGPSGKLGETDGATACTSCHSQRDGVLACSTCHGAQERSYPPRDACYFGGRSEDPHAAHVADPQVRLEPLSCGTCHPVPEPALFGGVHADGRVDVRFSAPLRDPRAVFHEDGSCSVACHARGGLRGEPAWKSERKLDCQSCHLSPPQGHAPGTCDTCHRNMGDAPDSLRIDALHLNGEIDLGNGDGTCGSCHGHDQRGAPADTGHSQHLTSTLTQALVCGDCHRAPSLSDLHAPDTHMNGTRDVVFGARAGRSDPMPSYDPAQKACAQIACHGDARIEPRWGRASQAEGTCIACHSTPPPPPHSTLSGCGGGLCHGSEVTPLSPRFRITESGRGVHIDGALSIGD